MTRAHRNPNTPARSQPWSTLRRGAFSQLEILQIPSDGIILCEKPDVVGQLQSEEHPQIGAHRNRRIALFDLHGRHARTLRPLSDEPERKVVAKTLHANLFARYAELLCETSREKYGTGGFCYINETVINIMFFLLNISNTRPKTATPSFAKQRDAPASFPESVP